MCRQCLYSAVIFNSKLDYCHHMLIPILASYPLTSKPATTVRNYTGSRLHSGQKATEQKRRERKRKIGQRSEPSGELGRGKSLIIFRLFFPAAEIKQSHNNKCSRNYLLLNRWFSQTGQAKVRAAMNCLCKTDPSASRDFKKTSMNDNDLRSFQPPTTGEGSQITAH